MIYIPCILCFTLKEVLFYLGPSLAVYFPIVHRKHKYLLSKVLLDQNRIMVQGPYTAKAVSH